MSQTIHAKASISKRAIWRRCPLSVLLSDGVEESPSPVAQEGTIAHGVAEWHVRRAFNLDDKDTPLVLLNPPEGLDLKGRSVEEWHDELIRHALEYVKFIKALIPNGERHFITLERRVCVESVSPSLFGTLDLVIWLPDLKKLIIVDYKYGYADVEVGKLAPGISKPRDLSDVIDVNPQLGGYLVGLLDQLPEINPISGIILAISQPRRSWGATAKMIEFPYDLYAQERAAIKQEYEAVQNATLASTSPVPGDHCKYCKGKSKCPAVLDLLVTATNTDFDILKASDDEIIDMWAAKTAVKALLDNIDERIEALVKNRHGRLVLKETQGRRRINDSVGAVRALLAVNRVDLLSPPGVTELEAALPPQICESLIVRGASTHSIRLASPVELSRSAAVFRKYAKKT